MNNAINPSDSLLMPILPYGQHIITGVFLREADESPVIRSLRAKTASVIGYYRSDIIRIVEHGVRDDEIENILKSIS